jgi:hypothetical protein
MYYQIKFFTEGSKGDVERISYLPWHLIKGGEMIQIMTCLFVNQCMLLKRRSHQGILKGKVSLYH